MPIKTSSKSKALSTAPVPSESLAPISEEETMDVEETETAEAQTSDAVSSDTTTTDSTKPKRSRGPSFPWTRQRYEVVRDAAQALADENSGSVTIPALLAQVQTHDAMQNTQPPLTYMKLASAYSGWRERLTKEKGENGEPLTPAEVDAILPPVESSRGSFSLL